MRKILEDDVKMTRAQALDLNGDPSMGGGQMHRVLFRNQGFSHEGVGDDGGLSKEARKKLGNLAGDADKTVYEAIKSRGGGGSQVHKLQTGYGELTLGEAAELAVNGDAKAGEAIKIVKQSGSQGKGGK